MPVTIEVDIDGFNDDDIIYAVIDRGIVARVMAAAHARLGMARPRDPELLIREAMEALLGRRMEPARQRIDAAIELLLPPDLCEAQAAVAAGDRDTAICRLEA